MTISSFRIVSFATICGPSMQPFIFTMQIFFGALQLDLAPPRGNDDIIDQATCGQRRRPQP